MEVYGWLKVEKNEGSSYIELYKSKLELFSAFVTYLLEIEVIDEELIHFKQLKNWWKKRLVQEAFNDYYTNHEFFIIKGTDIEYISEKEVHGYAIDGYLEEIYKHVKLLQDQCYKDSGYNGENNNYKFGLYYD